MQSSRERLSQKWKFADAAIPSLNSCFQSHSQPVTWLLLKKLTSLSLSEIGKIIGRDHSTVHATLKKVDERMLKDDFFQKQMQTFLQEFEEKPVSMRTIEQKRSYSN